MEPSLTDTSIGRHSGADTKPPETFVLHGFGHIKTDTSKWRVLSGLMGVCYREIQL